MPFPPSNGFVHNPPVRESNFVIDPEDGFGRYDNEALVVYS